MASAEALENLKFVRTHLHCLDLVRTDPRMKSGWNKPADWREATLEGLVLKYGVAGHATKLPRGLRKGRYKLCFGNAFNRTMDANTRGTYGGDPAAWERDGLYYCEGYAVHGPVGGINTSGFVAHHAWLITADGTIYDPTWKWSPDHAYVGLPLTWDFVRSSLLRTKVYGVLYQDWRIMTDAPATYTPAPFLTASHLEVPS